ncbi:UbiA-like protein EboC [filamentous cyanobacterium LEGE 11480]|uniref:UbiA-like protein EboC n=2 Tax=Romeriopsis TaxID=2992131 RepID=A0A928Z2A2_9CYAN|nr:UbiA-like protein EboC [Romeriopsis navalis LEGE 11480]
MQATQQPPFHLRPYLQMLRPANIVTAWADILVGYGATGLVQTDPSQIWPTLSGIVPLLWLLLATTGLYGGGIVFNDVFDAELDAVERPERPIPSGRATLNYGIFLGTVLLLGAIVAAAQVSLLSAEIACVVAFSALTYDAIGKHHPVFGPLNMGLCRGGNWLLGMSVVPGAMLHHGVIVLVPIVYIAAITLMSRGEVDGGDRLASQIALGLLLTVAIGLMALTLLPDYIWLSMLPLGLIWLGLVLPAFIKATTSLTPDLIRQAVRTGVISLIALDAATVAGFSGWLYGGVVLALLPLSRWLASRFAVT